MLAVLIVKNASSVHKYSLQMSCLGAGGGDCVASSVHN